MNKRTVVFDFDGVIHSYKSGWKGAAVIPDPPVPGIDRALKNIHDAGYETVIVSTRCATGNGKKALWEWLVKYGIDDYIDCVCMEKPPAIVYIDDRAIRLDGNPDGLLEQIAAFSQLWDSLLKPADLDKYGWFANPWVWVIAFERVPKPESWPET